MTRSRLLGLRLPGLMGALLLGSLTLPAQNVPGSGWSSFGILPFRGYDFRLMKAPTQYVMYFSHHADTGTYEGPDVPLGRAFSPDLKTWTLDTGDICGNSGDYCKDGNAAGSLQLPDGRIRMYFGGGSLGSAISSDGITWTKEPGIRFAADSSSIYERGNGALTLVSFVTLPGGTIRMYYEGGVVDGSVGTPAYYNSIFANGMILSALSKDGGLTWTREAGVRVNPLVQGPDTNLKLPDGTPTSQFSGTDFSAVAVQENGQTVYRIYAASLDTTVSYISSDGLTFALEGTIPASANDPKAFIMPDGRTWLITNQYPDGLADILVFGPQTFSINSVRAAVGAVPVSGFAAPFQSVLMGITGTSPSPVTLEAPVGNANACATPPCSFHPEYYSFSPASGTPPFSTVVSYTGPANYASTQVIVHAKSSTATAAGSIDCMTQRLGLPGVSVFCGSTTVTLPMTQLSFALAPSGPPATQTSNILSLGGTGYPFQVTSSVPWLTVSPASGTAPMSLQVTANPAGLTAGSYSAVLTITAEGTTEAINVTATVSTGPVITGIQNSASSGPAVAANGFLTIYGNGLAAAPVTWSPTTSLPTTLGGASVRINGEDAFISYASPGQLNVLAPPDTPPGTATVQVTAASGQTTSNAVIGTSAPAWFTYNVTGPTWLAALFGNSSTYVAPQGSIPGVTSRSAKIGDYLQLYANGLGATNPTAPSGAVLTTAYALDDLSRIKLTIGGQLVPVLYAGLVSAGLYQVNIQVPPGLGTGELPIVMTVDGQATQLGVTLNFQ